MADTTTSRPKPRPKPKPIRKQPSNTASSATPDVPSSSSSTVPASTAATQRVIEINDVDQMFIRNTNRTNEAWQRLDKIDRATQKEKKESSDTDDATTPRKGYKNKRKKQEVVHSQPWQNPKELTRILSEDLSDSDVELVGESPKADIKLQGKRKRHQKSRSRSITPPPVLPSSHIQIAKNLVREALRAATPRRASPTFNSDEDEFTETIIFQPELRAIAQEIKKQHERFSSQAPETAGEDNIDVNVRWNPHPLSQDPSKPVWDFQMSRTDTFRDLFEAISEEAAIQSAHLIMTYQGNRIFPSVTPHTLKIWTDSFELDAYEKSAYDYIQANAMANLRPVPQTTISRPTISSGAVVDINSDDEEDDEDPDHRPTTTAASPPPPPAPTQSQTQSQPHESESESEAAAPGNTFRITLRSSLGKDVTLTVRHTTKCGAIVKAFLKKAGVAEQYPEVFMDKTPVAPPPTAKRGRKSNVKAAPAPAPAKAPRLYIDGEKMDNELEIGDELEDGDMVDVVGL